MGENGNAIKDLLANAESRMHKTIEALNRELATVRTGRANPALVEHVKVDYHGVLTPLKQVASIVAPEPRLLVIQPWERQVLPNIEKAILKSDLSLNPSNDGNVIRLVIPELTEERRTQLVKTVHKVVEDHRIVVRNIRRDALEKMRALKANKEISEDENKRSQNRLQQITDGIIAQIDQIAKDKEAELLRH